MQYYKSAKIPVDVLGSAYDLFLTTDKEEPRFDKLNCDGFCDSISRRIYVNCNVNDAALSDPRLYIFHTIKHELVHAFLYESGLSTDFEHAHRFGHEETMVDWIAIQMPKIISCYRNLTMLLEPYKMEDDNTCQTGPKETSDCAESEKTF